jgi:hypothetical protein
MPIVVGPAVRDRSGSIADEPIPMRLAAPADVADAATS